MVDEEVESVLREIRERVRRQEPPSSASASSALSNGQSFALTSLEESKTAAETLALIDSYLTTTARAWDRLPPIVSNRRGMIARLELWLKRRLKRATRWYAWEQVNFNAAVHHALRDMLSLLSAYEQELGKLRAEIKAEAEARQIEFEKHQTDLAAQRAELETQRGGIEAQRTQVDARLAELRERDERLQEEQRVCFKQLALETSEAAVLEDRARRKTEALLEELKRRVGELEKR